MGREENLSDRTPRHKDNKNQVYIDCPRGRCIGKAYLNEHEVKGLKLLRKEAQRVFRARQATANAS